ncbi:pentatricopeptide repeat-containing protein At1g74630-like [Wolffia australiana]
MEPLREHAQARRALSLRRVVSQQEGADVDHLRRLHASVIRLQLHRTCHFTVGNLITRFAVLGLMPYALKIFQQMPEPNSFVWNSLIRGFLHTRQPDAALLFLRSMARHGAHSDSFTFLNALRACTDLRDPSHGRRVHAQLVKAGWGDHPSAGTALIGLYSACSEPTSARQAFDEIPLPDHLAWTAAVAGLAENGDVAGARRLFEEMPLKDLVVCSVMIAGHVKAGEMGEARRVFDGAPARDLLMRNTLLGGYAASGEVEELLELFEGMPDRDVVSWNTAISCLAREGRVGEAMAMVRRMRLSGVGPNEVTMASLLSGCARAGALGLGRQIHGAIKGEVGEVVTTALVDMYAKCGELAAARAVFAGAPRRDAAVWNAMIGGLCANGRGAEAVELFGQMRGGAARPNWVTMVAVLSACAREGLVEEGRRWFGAMAGELGVEPGPEHYGCMVDLLGRAGLLQEAREVARGAPAEARAGVWGALLGACRIHGEVEMAEQAMESLLQLGDRDGGYVAAMANVYVAAGRWADAARARRLIAADCLATEAGRSAVVGADHCE